MGDDGNRPGELTGMEKDVATEYENCRTRYFSGTIDMKLDSECE